METPSIFTTITNMPFFIVKAWFGWGTGFEKMDLSKLCAGEKVV